MEYKMKVMSVEDHGVDVRRFVLARPSNYALASGKFIQIAFLRPGMEGEWRGYPVSSSAKDFYIEVVAKIQGRDRFADAMRTLKAGEEVLVSDEEKGTLQFKGSGVFIASGIGIVPFSSWFRHMRQEDGSIGTNMLIYSGRTREDFLFEREIRHVFGKQAVFLASREALPGYDTRKMDEEFLRSFVGNFTKPFYVAGSESFIGQVKEMLIALGATNIQTELVE